MIMGRAYVHEKRDALLRNGVGGGLDWSVESQLGKRLSAQMLGGGRLGMLVVRSVGIEMQKMI